MVKSKKEPERGMDGVLDGEGGFEREFGKQIRGLKDSVVGK